MRNQHYPQDHCNTFWGSHGCRLEFDHEGPCECGDPFNGGVCSTYERGVGVRFHFIGRPADFLSEPDINFTAWGDRGDEEKSRA